MLVSNYSEKSICSTEETGYVVAALYKFTALPDYKDLQKTLLALGKKEGLKGSLLLALEGINGTVSGSRHAIDRLRNFFNADLRFNGIEYKESFSLIQPFYRYKVRLKKEIVTLGVPSVDPTIQVGEYVSPEDWNTLMSDPDLILIDTRNDYEVRVGTFKGAINPKTKSFREFPEFIRDNFKNKSQKKIALFCTGGIRCEKASSLMLQEGFEKVYHLKGGILKYIEHVPKDESLWEGECFVFDHRVAMKHGLDRGEYVLCYGCRSPLSPTDLKSSQYEEGVSCPYCQKSSSEEQKERARTRHAQVQRAKMRGISHIGASAL